MILNTFSVTFKSFNGSIRILDKFFDCPINSDTHTHTHTYCIVKLCSILLLVQFSLDKTAEPLSAFLCTQNIVLPYRDNALAVAAKVQIGHAGGSQPQRGVESGARAKVPNLQRERSTT